MTKRDLTEMTPALKKRVKQLKKKARDYIAKTEIVQFRLDEQTYQDLFSIAENERRPVGTIVREWVTERVQQESTTKNKRGQTNVSRLEITTLQKQLDDIKRRLAH